MTLSPQLGSLQRKGSLSSFKLPACLHFLWEEMSEESPSPEQPSGSVTGRHGQQGIVGGYLMALI